MVDFKIFCTINSTCLRLPKLQSPAPQFSETFISLLGYLLPEVDMITELTLFPFPQKSQTCNGSSPKSEKLLCCIFCTIFQFFFLAGGQVCISYFILVRNASQLALNVSHLNRSQTTMYLRRASNMKHRKQTKEFNIESRRKLFFRTMISLESYDI